MIKLFFRIFNKIYRIFLTLYYKLIFKQVGKDLYIRRPIKIDGGERISVGAKVSIGWGVWLVASPHIGFVEECELIIEDGVSIGNFAHIYATKRIHIKKMFL